MLLNPDLNAEILTKDKLYKNVENENDTKIIIKFINNGEISWPKNTILACHQHLSSIKGNSNPIKLSIEPFKEVNLEVDFEVRSHGTGTFGSFWQLKTEKGEFFGPMIKFEVNILKNFQKNAKIENNFVNSQYNPQKSYNYIDLTDSINRSQD